MQGQIAKLRAAQELQARTRWGRELRRRCEVSLCSVKAGIWRIRQAPKIVTGG